MKTSVLYLAIPALYGLYYDTFEYHLKLKYVILYLFALLAIWFHCHRAWLWLLAPI
ncbi:MAG: hypothetical protein ACFB15_07635 [Cyclobacteriaceae bacterium]